VRNTGSRIESIINCDDICPNKEGFTGFIMNGIKIVGLFILLVLLGAIFGYHDISAAAAITYQPVTAMDDSIGNDTYKEIIIRFDDASRSAPALKLVSDLAIRKNIKMTFLIIPTDLSDQNLINYLNSLDSNRFEMATHGFAHNETFDGMQYLGQYDLINRSTKIMQLAFHKRPESFCPTFNKADSNTARALKALKYHSITGIDYSDNELNGLEQFPTDIYWELTEGKESTLEGKFDILYISPKKTILIGIHTNDPRSRQNAALINQLEKFIDHLKERRVKFVTIEEAHQLHESVKQATKLQQLAAANVSGKWSIKFNGSPHTSMDLNLWASDRTVMGYGTLTEAGVKNSVMARGSVNAQKLTLIVKANEKDEECDLDLFVVNGAQSGTYVLKSGKLSYKGNVTAIKQ
jgi:peptidoglycan/xylan/chitin deacetylase (PgdA/CDA1 family)